MVDARPPQPRLLDDILGIGGGAEEFVGDGEQQAAVPGEHLLARADMGYPAAVGCARGRSQTFEKPWLSIPSAVLVLAAMLANATQAVTGNAGDALELAFPVERFWQSVGVRVRQRAARVVGEVVNPPAVWTPGWSTPSRAQVGSILSLDVDGSDFAAVGR